MNMNAGANSRPRKLMLLGGLRYLTPVIEAAHRRGIYVITCDYIPGNYAHSLSDEYHNVSILDRDKVLALARELQIDGIMSFAVDPGVTTAAYVAEKMGLPFQGSLESVEILQRKDRFRRFLALHGFNVPQARGFSSAQEVLAAAPSFSWPVMVKPVDSAGSKGVSQVRSADELPAAIAYALEESHSSCLIVEDYLEPDGAPSDSECFSVNGELRFCSFSDQRFDSSAPNPFTPSAYSWPSSMPEAASADLRAQLQRLITLLGLRTGIYNVETRLCTNGKAYIMEVSPRGGGNRLAEMLTYVTGVDLVDCAVCAAMGMEVELPRHVEPLPGYVAEVILHAPESGRFVAVEVNPGPEARVIDTDLWVNPGEQVHGFTGANRAIGTLAVRFDTREALERALSNITRWCGVIIESSHD